MRTELSTAAMSALNAVPSASSAAPWMCRAIGNGAGRRPAGQRVQRSRSASRPSRSASSATDRSDRSAPFQVAETAASWRGPRRAPLAHRQSERGAVAHANTANVTKTRRKHPSWLRRRSTREPQPRVVVLPGMGRTSRAASWRVRMTDTLAVARQPARWEHVA